MPQTIEVFQQTIEVFQMDRTAADEGETQIPHSFLALMHVHEQLLKTSIDHREIEEKSKITGTMTPRRWTWKRALLSRYIC